jgi:hypothetical protein
MARCWVLLCLLIAGQGWAGDAWVADYRIRDAQGERSLVLIRDDTRIEYRVPGEPVHSWRRTPDGIELRELHPDAHRVIVYTPGDLRAMDRAPDWVRLAGLVDPALRAGLVSKGEASAFGQRMTRYRGDDTQGLPVQLDWLAVAGLPVRLSVGTAGKGQRNDEARGGDAIRLLALKQVSADLAFTAVDGLLEIDHADLGDMELDPFVRGLSHAEHPLH